MEKQVAQDFMLEILKISKQLNVIAGKIESSITGEELTTMRSHIARMMAASDENLFRPILRQYPELDPLNTSEED